MKHEVGVLLLWLPAVLSLFLDLQKDGGKIVDCSHLSMEVTL